MEKNYIPLKLSKAYSNMKSRCYNHNLKDYKYYGGKGIKICSSWLENKMRFIQWALNNGYDDTLILGRKNINKDYSPDNCKWMTFAEQQSNRTNNVYIEVDGISKTIPQWSRESGISASTIYNRIKDNEDILKEISHIVIEINGKTKTLKQLSTESGIPYNTICQRYYKGWEPEKLTTELLTNETKYIEINGEIHTIAEWATISGLRKEIIAQRINRGWKNEDLLKPKMKEGTNKKYIEVNGEFHTKDEWCEIIGISPNAFYNRMKKGLKGKDLIAPVPKREFSMR